MRIALTHNLRTEETQDQSEWYREDEVQLLIDSIEKLEHEVIPIEVSGPIDQTIDTIIDARPDLIFNVAEGGREHGTAREAYFPAVFTRLGIPFTGGGPALLHVNLDKRLTETLMDVRGIRTPRGANLTPEHRDIPEDMPFPAIVKPNAEGTSKGITQDSVVEDAEAAQTRVDELLKTYPAGVEIEQFLQGKELTVPFLQDYPGQILEIVEHDFSKARGEYDIYDYELKQTDENVELHCPARLDNDTRQAVLDMCASVLKAMPCPDLGRIDIRLDADDRPYFLELNALPRLMPDGSLIIAAKDKGMDYPEIMRRIIRSAARRYEIPIAPRPASERGRQRPAARDCGVTVGRFPPGENNAITDVDGVMVGHVTHVADDVEDPSNGSGKTAIRTGITAIVPGETGPFNNHLMAGGFALNGVGEVSGMMQAMEWGWLETPILLSNTMSLGKVHAGVIQYMIDKHPDLGRKVEVIIPIIAETDDSFLNDVRLPTNTPEDAIEAIRTARPGPVEQGSVGGGTGMITFDFAGGIGTSSRRLGDEMGGYTVGVLVQSNFGKMRNLTIDGRVVGRDLDPLYPMDIRQGEIYGSVIVVVATDAPLLTQQLNRLSKRAALGLGRVGTWAASTSGEIVFAFSTANCTSREAKAKAPRVAMDFVSDLHINPLYEATVECTEEAVLNAMFCSGGQTGRDGRFAPALPVEQVQKLLGIEPKSATAGNP